MLRKIVTLLLLLVGTASAMPGDPGVPPTVHCDGERLNGKMHGHGRCVYPDPYGGTYEGTFRDDYKEGRGTYVWLTGARYEGEWHMNVAHGFGVYRSSLGTVYAGQWFNGCFSEGELKRAVGVMLTDCGF